MGFRTGAFAKIFEIIPVTPNCTKLRMSISYKNKQTGQYEQDFSGYVSVFGVASAAKAAALPVGARIKIGDCDVGTKYDKVKKVQYTNFKIYSFEEVTGYNQSSAPPASQAPAQKRTEPEPDNSDGRLPF